MDSSRLPEKTLKLLGNKTVLEHVLNQIKHSRLVQKICVATTIEKEDDKIVDLCNKNNVDCFRGSSTDVLDRFFQCAKKYDFKIIVRISADSPLIDPQLIDKAIQQFQTDSYDYVSNNIERTNSNWIDSPCNFPQGMVVEVSSFNVLEKAWKESKKPSEREHVFPYVQFNPNKFRISNFTNQQHLSHIRCSLDNPEDLDFLENLYKRLDLTKEFFVINDIVEIINQEPELVSINNHIQFDEGTQLSYKKDKEMGYSEI